MSQVAQLVERPDAALISALEAARMHPLWDRYQRITPMHPRSRDESLLWRWRDIEPLTARAASEVAIEDVERRAIIMVNPAFGGQTVFILMRLAAQTARPWRRRWRTMRSCV